MEPQDRHDPLARERARKRRAQQIRRRRIVFGAGVICLIALIVGLAVGLSGSDDTETATTNTTGTSETSNSSSTGQVSATYTANLTGSQSVPPVETAATGTLTLKQSAEDNTLSYVLEVTELTSPTMAAIYEGSAGTEGAAIVDLLPDPPAEGLSSGVLAEGPIEAGNLTGSLQGKTIQDLITLIKSGNTYVSVGNTSHPVDAIRGQIE